MSGDESPPRPFRLDAGVGALSTDGGRKPWTRAELLQHARHLTDAMWDLTRELEARKREYHSQHEVLCDCGAVMLSTPATPRTYCSNACRQRAYRQRYGAPSAVVTLEANR